MPPPQYLLLQLENSLPAKPVNKMVTEIMQSLPLDTLDAVLVNEDKLKNAEYAKTMKEQLYKLKWPSEDVNGLIRKLFSDEVLSHYNWDGRWEKHALSNLTLISDILSDVFKELGRFEFKKSVKRAIELSHNRMKQRRFVKSKQQAEMVIS